LRPRGNNDQSISTYGPADFKRIAAAIGLKPGQIAKHDICFEAAAGWYRSDDRAPTGTAPSKMRAKLQRISKSARRLLKSLGVDDPDDAPDGPGNSEIVDALVLAGDRNEGPVVEATRRIGRLVEIVEAVAAAAEFDRRAKKATTEVTEHGKLTVRQGHTGDAAVNEWIAAMMGLYKRITGKEPATSVGSPTSSVGSPERPDAGIACGPLIRFLKAAGKPLEIEYSEDAWRSRVRTILRGASPKTENDLAM
jgi:hypothetical protein